MLTKDTKKTFIAILLVVIALALTTGIRTCVIVTLAICCAGMLLITVIWLIGFFIIAAIEHSLSYAWDCLHLAKMLHECFCEQEEKSEN